VREHIINSPSKLYANNALVKKENLEDLSAFFISLSHSFVRDKKMTLNISYSFIFLLYICILLSMYYLDFVLHAQLFTLCL